MQKIINVSDLFRMCGMRHQGKVAITHPDMTGLEPNPKDDWLYLGLLSLRETARIKGDQIKSAAFIGSGNGIETIAALKLFSSLEKIFVTDLVKDIQPGIIQNIRLNVKNELKKVEVKCLAGRDCHPLPEKVDLIYGNLPIMVCDTEEIEKHHLARTTLTDAHEYAYLSQGKNDILEKYSLLSQLGFLLSAKEKLSAGGCVLTLIGGRVPYAAIDECFRRAGLNYCKMYTSFMRQSDCQFLKQYAEYEAKKKVNFAFYDCQRADDIICDKLAVAIPEIITGLDDDNLKELLKPALLTAQQAYQFYLKGKPVGHIAYAFEAWKKN